MNCMTIKLKGLFIEINLPQTKPILVGIVYRPPNSNADYMDTLGDVFQKCNVLGLYNDVFIL